MILPGQIGGTARALLIPALVGALVVVSGQAAGAAGAEPDLSTPAKALAFFIRSFESGDAASLRAVVTGDENQLEWVQALAAQWASLKRLESALGKQFGEDYIKGDKGRDAKDRIAGALDDDLHADLLHAKLGDVNGDATPVVLDEAAPDSHQGRLVRAGARWKFDLASLSDYVAPDDLSVLKAVGAAAAELAHDVTAGKFATMDDAAIAIEDRLDAAVEAATEKKKTATSAEPRESRGVRPRAN